MKTVGELNEYIAKGLYGVRPDDRGVARLLIAGNIAENTNLVYLLHLKSSFSTDELLILKEVDKIMSNNKNTINLHVDPESFGGSDFEELPPIVTPEQDQVIQQLYNQNPILQNDTNKLFENLSSFHNGAGLLDGFDLKAAWIQTFSGRRFNPTNPNPKAIVIQDIAHSLSMQCRFSGHCKYFYSVAQHSVLVSHVCNSEDALWGLLHDASEAYLVDIPRPLKQSGKFEAYKEMEAVMQKAICQRFSLPEREPPSVKRADKVLLATEARDLMSPLHPDWRHPALPLPFHIEAWGPTKAEKEFLDRFYYLINAVI